MAKNRPSILDIAPAEQDATRVGGLMEDIEVPDGEYADMDIMKEQIIEMGFPVGLVNDFIEKAKADPASQKKKGNVIMKILQEDPGALEELKNFLPSRNSEVDFPDDFGGDQGAF